VAAGVLGVGIAIRCDDPDFRDFGSNLDRAEQLGADFVEIPTLAMDLIANGRVLRERVRRAKAMLECRPFRYTVHGPIGINLMDVARHQPLHEAVLLSSLDIAGEFGAVHYIMHCGVTGEGREPAAACARQRDGLARAGDFARERGLIIAIENVFTRAKTMYTALPSKLAREVDRLCHPNVMACLDVSHAFLQAAMTGVNFLAEAVALAPVTKHLHVHDSFGRPAEIVTHSPAERLAFGQGDLHLPVGWGAIPWAELMEKCCFAEGVVFIIELDQRYWAHAEATVAATRALAAEARTGDLR
jgi:sugar phosphate isomerase/epimerase